MEEATNLFENSKNETKALSTRIDKLATQVSRMEEKCLEERQAEEEPRHTEPPPQLDRSPAPATAVAEPPARRSDAPLRVAKRFTETAARCKNAPPSAGPATGSAFFRGGVARNSPASFDGSSIIQGGCRGESSRFPHHRQESICAATAVDYGIPRPKDRKDVDFARYWKENFVDDDGEEMSKEAWDSFRRLVRESTRAHHEEKLNNLSCVLSAKVELNKDTGTMDHGVSLNVEVVFDDKFARVRDILLRDGNCSDNHILWYVEGIAKFVDDVEEGTRDIGEITNLGSFEECLDVIYGKEKKEKPGKEVLKEEEIVALMERVEDTTIKDEEKPEARPGRKIDVIMVRIPRKKRNKKKSSKIA